METIVGLISTLFTLVFLAAIVLAGAVLAGWPGALPPVGAELLECDGLLPEQRLRQIARYYDVRDLPGVRHALASVFTELDMPGEELKRCTFRTAQGETVQLPQHYREVMTADYRVLAKSRPRPRRSNGYALQDGVLSIAAESTAWATQLRMLQSQILAKIAAAVGPGVVRQLKITGPAAPSWRKGERHIKGRGPRDTYG